MDNSSRGQIVEKIKSLTEPLAEARGLMVLEVEYKPGGQLLRVYLDRRLGQVGIDDCSAVSEQLSAILDEVDIIPHTYRLEVSSPGLDRPLRGEGDFIRFKGEAAVLTLSQPAGGSLVVRGTIGDIQNGMLRLAPQGQEPLWVPLSQIRSARLDPAAPKPPRPGKGNKKKR